MAHSKLSPSKWDKYMICAGAAAAEAGYERRDTPAALFGTQCHALLEICIINGVWEAKPQTLYLYDADGETLILSSSFDHPVAKDARETWPMSQDHLDVANHALSYLQLRVQQLSEGRPAALRSEQKVDCGPLIGRTDVSGTADVIIVSGDSRTLEVFDLKGGRGFVPVDTKQLIAYGGGALLDYRRADGSYPFETVRLTICQPRAEGADDQAPGIRWVETTPAELEAKVIEVGPLLALCDAPDAPRTPGPHCDDKFCAHKVNCGERRQWLANLAGPAFGGLLVSPADILPKKLNELRPCPVTDLTTEQLETLYAGWDRVKKFGDDLEKELEFRVDAGMSRRYKLIEGRSVRRWAVDTGTLERRLRSFGLRQGDFLKTEWHGPAVIEKLPQIRDLDDGKRKKFEALIEKPDGKPKLAPIDSPKPAVKLPVPTNSDYRYVGLATVPKPVAAVETAPVATSIMDLVGDL